MPREYPKEFSMKDLFIDVELKVCSNGTTFDFLGRKLFNTSFFRKDTGFGIINIDVEVNTSLQPLVVVTLKDLYGNTVFGEQSRTADPDDNQSIDYSVLFDWPPPKFLFSFKGYLGNPVSWLLNLKRTSTSFNSSDGSYEIKCEFVPNQWGFFADLPMLFLLAAKPLRRERLGSNATPDQKKKVTSVYDLIKIGKQVEVKTQDTTKEFDKLVKQLGSMKSSIGTALTGSRIISFGETVNGVVNNIQVKKFREIIIPELGTLDPAVSTEEKINRKLGSASSLSKLNTYLLLSLRFDNQSGFELNGIPNSFSSLDPSSPAVSSAKNAVIALINENLRFIDDEIKRRVFSTSEKKLEKITIGEVFSQLAKDSAFILGSILDAGIDGYYSNKGVRDGLSDRLIGEAFPLVINEDGEEVPATSENLKSSDIGVDSFEMDFVRRFINAISEGIAKDMPTSDLTDASQDSTLKTRVNNLEMAEGNPYKPFYQSIATNILVRGGIVGYVTRSFDPNYPGEWGNWVSDNDGPEGISELATRDVENITDGMLSELSDYDTLLLKRFCRFFLRFYDRAGEKLLDEKGEPGASISATSGSDHDVIMDERADGSKDVLKFSQLISELRKPIIVDETPGLEDYPVEVIENDPGVNVTNVNVEHPLSFVNMENFTASRIINNNLAYMVPDTSDILMVAVFEREMNSEAQKANSAPSDAELKSGEKDDPVDIVDLPSTEGYVPIDAFEDSEGEELGRIGILQEYANVYQAVNANKLRYPLSSFYQPDSNPSDEYLNHTWRKLAANGPSGLAIYESAEAAYNDGVDNINKVSIVGSIGFTAYAHFLKNDYVFAPFGGDRGADDQSAINQRVFIRRACEVVLNRLSKLEDEKNQVVGSVLGKAGEQEVGLYKQMHTLFHQWQALAYDSGNGFCSGTLEKGQNVANRLEEKFGGTHTDIVSEKDVNGLPDGSFIYEFPLQRIVGAKGKPIKVRDSIINLEALYQPNADTSVLNIIQQICTKNNFLFIPIPGNATYLDVSDLYSPKNKNAVVDLRNFFHVLFTPTPESRAKSNNKDPLALSKQHLSYDTNSFAIKYGSPDNQIVSNIQVGTDDNKVTAESVVNLQRLVDNENQNKKVTTDCSVLPVLEGRSYNASIDMIGNAQVYPMQFFFMENSPLFGGLYQVMKVKHSITPNDMKTSVEGMRMRFSPGNGYGSIKPITLATYSSLGSVNDRYPFDASEVDKIVRENAAPGGGTNSGGNTNAPKSSPTGKPPIIKTIIENGGTNGNIVGGNIFVAHIPKISGINNLKIGNDRENYLLFNAVAPLEKMLNDWVTWMKENDFPGQSKSGNYYALITGVFRDYQKQVEIKKQYGNAAAAPGSSNHGWGIAVDFQFFTKSGGIIPNTKNTPAYFSTTKNPAIKWLYDNAYVYGWTMPWTLRDGSFLNEHWHFEYHGTAAKLFMQKQNNTYGYVTTVNRPIDPIVTNPKNKDGERAVYNSI